MTELERRLEAAADAYFPATPNVARAVRARLADRPPRRVRLAAAAAIAAAAVAAGVLAVSSGARSAVVDLLDRLPGIHIERVEKLPLVGYDATPDFGTEIAFDEARRRFGRTLRLPSGVGDPDHLYWLDYPPGDMITAVFGGDDRRARLVFSQWKTGGPVLFWKTVGDGTNAEPLAVDGAPGVWISGGEHIVWFAPPNDPTREFASHAYLAGNVLAWRRGDVIYRLEAAVSQTKALELARSLEER